MDKSSKRIQQIYTYKTKGCFKV